MARRLRSLPVPARARRVWVRWGTPDGFRQLSLIALVGLWVIVPSGALVRLTKSGLGCPDWPLCNGQFVPAVAGHELIEYSNRILSAAVMAFCVLAYLRSRGVPNLSARTRLWALGAALATVGQIPLGAVTVQFDLHPVLVGSHFLLSMVALLCGAVLALRAHDHARGITRRRSPQAWLAGLTALALGVGLVTGVLVTAAGPHSGDDGYVPRIGEIDDAAWLHVRAVVTFAGLALALAAWTWLTRRARPADGLLRWVLPVLLPLIGAQIAVGEYQYHNGLPWEVVQVHVSLAGLLWALTVVAAWRIAWVAEPAAEPGQPRLRDDTAWQDTQRVASGTIRSRAAGIGSPQSTQIP